MSSYDISSVENMIRGILQSKGKGEESVEKYLNIAKEYLNRGYDENAVMEHIRPTLLSLPKI